MKPAVDAASARAGQLVLPLLPPARETDLRRYVAPDWRARAACAGKPSAMFYPDEDTDPTAVTAAKQLCVRCEARAACRAIALLDDETGIWGGTTSTERDELRTALSTGTTAETVLAAPIERRGEQR